MIIILGKLLAGLLVILFMVLGLPYVAIGIFACIILSTLVLLVINIYEHFKKRFKQW